MPGARAAAAASGLPAVTKVSDAMRQRMEAAIDSLLAALDALDGDPDFEPSLGCVHGGAAIDVEDEHDGCEPDNDAESTATELLGRRFLNSAFGDEEEDGCDAEGDDPDREPTLGWSEGESLLGSLAAINRDDQEEFA